MLRHRIPLFVSLLACEFAMALPPYVDSFKARYPSTTLDSRLSCTICHTGESYALSVNCYKRDLANLGGGLTIAQRIDMLDGVDSDGDGVANGVEATTARSGGGVGFSPGLIGSNGRDPCGANQNLAVSGVCESPTDTDGDGTIDCLDGCPNDSNKTSPGTCGCGNADADSDGDGELDCVDECPGADDHLDANNDGVPDCLEGPVIMVNSSADSVDASPGDGTCADSQGRCTLRAAIMEANANIDRNTIVLPAGTFTLTISGTGQGAEAGDLNIQSNLNITGAGAASTIIDGGGIDRVLDMGSYQSLIFVSNVTITGGNSTAFGGSGIYSLDNDLTLTNCVIRDNSLSNGAPHGGGVFAGGTLHMNSCTVSGNTITSSGSGGFGAGVICYYGGESTLTNCTISGNTAAGGGIGGGGGVAVLSNTVELVNCTITENSTAGLGAGVYADVSGSFSLTVTNTIIANNGGAPNCAAATDANHSGGHNLEDGDTCNFHSTGDLIDTGAMIGSLDDNGGPSPTYRLLAGSPAIDAGDAAACPSSDQRGFIRPRSGANGGTAVCDIGAFEFSDCDGNGIDDGSEAASGIQLPDCNANDVPDGCELAGNDCDENGIPDECEANADGDALIDACDPCPNDANNADTDGDGTPDCNDGCPSDPNKTALGACGCGIADADLDGDGFADCIDNCPTEINADQSDIDGDGAGDACDVAPADAEIGGIDDADADITDGVGDDDSTGSGNETSGESDDEASTDGENSTQSAQCGAGACGGAGFSSLAPTFVGVWLLKRRFRSAARSC